jgi:hypothetical protein
VITRNCQLVVTIIVIFLLSIVPSAYAIPTPQQNETWFVGGWRGRITQTNYGSYDGVFSFRAASVGQIFGTSTYVELKCGGELTLLSVSETTLEFQERLTYGSGGCISGVKKTLTF